MGLVIVIRSERLAFPWVERPCFAVFGGQVIKDDLVAHVSGILLRRRQSHKRVRSEGLGPDYYVPSGYWRLLIRSSAWSWEGRHLEIYVGVVAVRPTFVDPT